MATDDQPPDLITQLTDEVFRVNGLLLAQGDQLAGVAGLTAAQWQVLGRLADEPMTAAALARRRGLRRQSVQEIVDRLSRAGLLDKVPNDQDRRAPLLMITALGRAALDRIEPGRAVWAHARATTVPEHDLVVTLRTLRRLRDTPAEPAEDAPGP